MTVAKGTLLAAGLVGVIALGVVTGPTIRDKWSNATAPSADVTPSTDAAPVAPAKVEKSAARSVKTSPRVEKPAKEMSAKELKAAGAVETVAVAAWEPKLQNRVKAVLNPGSKPEIAAANFESAEQFMTVAHAARNTQVPFMVLKHRVLNQGQSLASVIHEFKPKLDAQAEVNRAREAARTDLDLATN